jgi:hypothetical protein
MKNRIVIYLLDNKIQIQTDQDLQINWIKFLQKIKLNNKTNS